MNLNPDEQDRIIIEAVWIAEPVFAARNWKYGMGSTEFRPDASKLYDTIESLINTVREVKDDEGFAVVSSGRFSVMRREDEFEGEELSVMLELSEGYADDGTE